MNQYIITELNKIRDMVDDTKDLSDQYREAGISSCVQSELTEIMEAIDNLVQKVRFQPYNPQVERDCPTCGGKLMCHRWCIDSDCGWDSIKELRSTKGGEHG